MSLVDYASSDDEQQSPPRHDGVAQPEDHHHHRENRPVIYPQPAPSTSPSVGPPNLHQHDQPTSSLQTQSSGQASQNVSPLLPPPFEKLPDASMLLSSPIFSQSVGADHSARVAAAMADNASRKREANGSSSSFIRGKIPKGNLPHSKNIPDTSSGLLTPPQLRGRSNVVTEDISKLFVQRNSKEKPK